MIAALQREIRRYDPQLILWYSPWEKCWLLLRLPEKYGTVPKGGFSDAEIYGRLRNGTIWRVLQLPHEPGYWLIDWLYRHDSWNRARAKEILLALERQEEESKKKMWENIHAEAAHAIRENWHHIRDELRGDTIFRKWRVAI